jgi:hypothetical protein
VAKASVTGCDAGARGHAITPLRSTFTTRLSTVAREIAEAPKLHKRSIPPCRRSKRAGCHVSRGVRPQVAAAALGPFLIAIARRDVALDADEIGAAVRSNRTTTRREGSCDYEADDYDARLRGRSDAGARRAGRGPDSSAADGLCRSSTTRARRSSARSSSAPIRSCSAGGRTRSSPPTGARLRGRPQQWKIRAATPSQLP